MPGGDPRRRGPARALLRAAARAGLAAAACSAGCGLLDVPAGSQSLLGGIIAGPSPTEAAEWAIDKYDPGKRYQGTMLLANAPFGGEPPYIALYEANATDPDAGVRLAAVCGLSLHGNPSHVPMLIDRLKDSDALVRVEAARGLQRVHSDEAIGPLLEALSEDPDPDVRTEAASALGQYPTDRVVQGLIAALADPQLATAETARRSLRTLTGQDFGLDRRAWLEWYDKAEHPFQAGTVYTYPYFSRPKHWYEYLPFVPNPPNEEPGTPAGMPLVGGAGGAR